MTLTPGYKQSEVGVIPEDWGALAIGSLAHFKSGDGISVAALHRESSDTPIPVYGGNGIAGFTSKATVREPVVVVGRVGQKCGEVYLTKGPAWITDNALFPRAIFRPLDMRFLALALKFAGLNDVRNRNDLPLITNTILHSVRIPFPPTRAEQSAIAEMAGNVESLARALDQCIAKKRDLKKAVMQQLLTGHKRLPGFQGEWELKQLGEVGRFSKGRGITKDEVVADGLPCVRYGEIYTQHGDYIKAFNSFVTSETAKQSQRLQKGDLLFAGSGETAEDIGKCVAFLGDEEAYAGGDIVIFRPSGQDSKYLGFLMNHSSVARQKARMGQGDAIVHISARNLARLALHLPARSEQAAIAEVLSDMDSELVALEQRRDKTLALKQGMMQQVLTGRVRLV